MTIRDIQKFSDIDVIREDEELEAFYDENIAMPEDIGDDRIIVYGALFRILGTDLIIAEGTYCNYNEDSGELEPDFSLSLLYDTHGEDEPDLDSPLYWEQDSPATMFHNYASMQQQLGCETEVLLERCVA